MKQNSIRWFFLSFMLVSQPIWGASILGPEKCVMGPQVDAMVRNLNHRPAVDLGFTNYNVTSTLALIRGFLGRPFSTYIDGLEAEAKNGGTPWVYIPGAGSGIYGIQLARVGMKVFAVSAHNFYDLQVKPLLNKNSNDYQIVTKQLQNVPRVTSSGGSLRYDQAETVPYILRIDEAEVGLFANVGPILGVLDPAAIKLQKFQNQNTGFMQFYWAIESPATEAELRNQMKAYAQTLLSAVKAEETSQMYNMKYDLVQNDLPSMPTSKFDTIIGAYTGDYYSVNRPALLELYFKKLKQGREAYFTVPFPGDTVLLLEPPAELRGKEIKELQHMGVPTYHLHNYLAVKYPNNFEFYETPHPFSPQNKLLIMRMKKGVNDPDSIAFFNELEAMIIKMPHHFPTIQYMPKGFMSGMGGF